MLLTTWSIESTASTTVPGSAAYAACGAAMTLSAVAAPPSRNASPTRTARGGYRRRRRPVGRLRRSATRRRRSAASWRGDNTGFMEWGTSGAHAEAALAQGRVGPGLVRAYGLAKAGSGRALER